MEPCTKKQKTECAVQGLLEQKQKLAQQMLDTERELAAARLELANVEEQEKRKSGLKKHPLHCFLDPYFDFDIRVLITNYFNWSYCKACFIPMPQNGMCICRKNYRLYPVCNVQIHFSSYMNVQDIVFENESLQEIWNALSFQQPNQVVLRASTSLQFHFEIAACDSTVILRLPEKNID
jgi:hypothetical protein